MTIAPPDPLPPRHVAIVGAGFTGTLIAVHLLRRGARVTLIERRERAGRGVAYSTEWPGHLLNVRSPSMSALPDDPDHFGRWLTAQGLAADGFAPRMRYGDYLGDLLSEAAGAAGERFRRVVGAACDVAPAGDGWTVRLESGDAVAADTVVLALGNLPPQDPPGIDPATLPADVYVANPWATDLAAGLTRHDTVLLVGTGLTTIDVALSLDAAGFAGTITALSRRGLMPHPHRDGQPSAPLADAPAGAPSALVHAVRQRAGGVDWRAAVDALRPYTQPLWQAASSGERRRMLRHLRPWWDVHRHRIAPAIAARIAALRSGDRLGVHAGKLVAVTPDGTGALVRWRTRGRRDIAELPVRRIVNCTGPLADVTRADVPLLQRLLARGLIRPDRELLGIDVTEACEAVGADGGSHPGLIVAGPLTKGRWWEIVAVPDLRVQAAALGARLAR